MLAFITRKHNQCNFMKSQPCSYFSKVHCEHAAENSASSVLQPACRILLSNTHLMAICFSVLFLFVFKRNFTAYSLTDLLLQFLLLRNSLYHKVFKIVVCSVKACGLWYLGGCWVSGCYTVLGKRWEHGI